MPMPNLREQLKSGKIRELGRRERKVGAAASDADRSFLPKIGRQALVNQEQGLGKQFRHDQSPPEHAFDLPYLPNAPPTANKPRRDRPGSSRVRLPEINEPYAPSDANKSRRACPDSSQVQLPVIGESIAPPANKPRRDRPNSSRVRLPEINEPYAPSDQDKSRRTLPDSSRVRLPEISESQFVSSRQTAHAQSDAKQSRRSRPDPSQIRLPVIGEPIVPTANKPRRDCPDSSRVRLPDIDESQFVSSRQPAPAQDPQDLVDDIDQYKLHPPAGKKPTRARAPSASVRFPSIKDTPFESQRKLNAGQSYSEYALNTLPNPPKPPAIQVTGESVIQTKRATRYSRLPVQNGTSARFNNPPKRAPAAEMAPELPTRPFTRHGHSVVSDALPSTRHGHGVVSDARPSTRHGHGVVSGDMDELTSETGLNQMSALDKNENSRRRGVGHSRDDDDGIKIHHIPFGEVDLTDPFLDMYRMDEERRVMIFKYSMEFEEFVRATNESIEKEKKEAKPKMRATNESIEKEQKEAKPKRKMKRP